MSNDATLKGNARRNIDSSPDGRVSIFLMVNPCSLASRVIKVTRQTERICSSANCWSLLDEGIVKTLGCNYA